MRANGHEPPEFGYGSAARRYGRSRQMRPLRLGQLALLRLAGGLQTTCFGPANLLQAAQQLVFVGATQR